MELQRDGQAISLAMFLKKPARSPTRKVMAKAARYSSGELAEITIAPISGEG